MHFEYVTGKCFQPFITLQTSVQSGTFYSFTFQSNCFEAVLVSKGNSEWIATDFH